MKFTLSWLKDHLDTAAAPAEIAERLTALGLEVEGVKDPAATMQGFVVGHVVSCAPHPDADRLRCLVVDTGTEKLSVVCGAPNARAGMKGVFAPAGSYIPGAGITLKKTKIRGQDSNGMMCSESELLISDAHEGIIELPEAAVTGSPAAVALGLDDPVFEIGLTPNRGDCAGVRGIARDLAAAGVGTLKPLAAQPVKGAFKNPVPVTLEDTQACPLFIGRMVRGVKNGPSPDWLRRQMEAVGLRPISALVDVTNYLSVGLCRPLHVFDAGKLKGGLRVRLSRKGETLAALNDKSYTLDDGMTVVCDDSGVLALGGVIGGVSSAVDENTRDVYIEAAYFDPLRTARTGQALQISSDARYRFERGVDPAFTQEGAEIATRMILDLCGGEAGELCAAGQVPDNTRVIVHAPERVRTLGGCDISEARQREILSALGFALDGWNVRTPAWRHDVLGAADIVEEVLRVEGYDKIPATCVTRMPGQGVAAPGPDQQRAGAARRALAVRGLCETVTWSFMDPDKADLFGAGDTQQKQALTLQNPISVEMSVMRPSVLPNLLDAAGRNADRGQADAALFEIGNIYKSTQAEGQVAVAAGLRLGNAAPRHWDRPARAVDAIDAKADALAVLEACGFNVAAAQVTTDAPAWYHPGRSGVLRMGNVALAHFGELHPAVMRGLKREEPVAAFEVFLRDVPQAKKKGTQRPLLKLAQFQPVFRDFAFLVDEKLETEKLVRVIRGVDRNLIVAVDIFDIYAGKGVEPDRKSVALGVTLQPVEKTLTDAEIMDISQKIISAVAQQAGGVLRAG